MVWWQLIAGGVLLLGGGEALVKGSVAVASRLGISKLLIGLTLVGFGTSTPELVASINAALAGSPGIALGNVVGSNIANVLLILGLSALLWPIRANPEAFRRDGIALSGATVLLVVVCATQSVGRIAGTVFVLLLAAYVVISYFNDRRTQDAAARLHEAEATEVMPSEPKLGLGLVLAIGGIAAVVFGADLLVDGAISLARTAGISETVIGLTLVAVGTSLPELVTSVMAALRRHGDVAFGNIVGSNIFNIFGIAGITSLVQPLIVPPEILGFDIWVMLGTTILLVAFTVSSWQIQRWEAAIFLAAYAAYLVVQLTPSLRFWA